MPKVSAIHIRKASFFCLTLALHLALYIAVAVWIGTRLALAAGNTQILQTQLDQATRQLQQAQAAQAQLAKNPNARADEQEAAAQAIAIKQREIDDLNKQIAAAGTPDPQEQENAQADSGGSGAAQNVSSLADNFKFGHNTLGKAGNTVAETSRNCGNQAGQDGCQKVAKSLESLSNYSDYADYASYAAVAGTVVPMVIYNSNQKKDLEQEAQIQRISGYVNIAAGAADIGIGAMARFNDASDLDKIQSSGKAACAQFQNVKAPPKDPNQMQAYEECRRFQNGKRVAAAADEVRSASTTHFLVGGLKAAGGAAALYLAAENEKNAKQLDTLANTATTPQAAQPATLLGPVALTSPVNSVGFQSAPAPTTPTTPTTNGNTRASSGASAAPDLPPGYVRRGSTSALAGGASGGGKPGGGGAKAGGLSGGGADSGASSAPGEEGVHEDPAAEWAGGGGNLNRGGVELGGGDGGFGNILGNLLGGNKDDGGGNKVMNMSPGRDPASDGRGQSNASGADEQNISIFDRVSGAIDRQVKAGGVVSSVNDVNKS